MSKTQLEIDSEGNITVRGDLPTPLPKGNENPAAWLKRFVLKMNEVRQLYQQLLADDGKLIGQERFELAESLEEALNHLVQIRALLEQKREFSAINMKYNYNLHIKLHPKYWEGRGRLGVFRKMNVTSFELWHSRFVKERLLKVIHFYAQAVSDGVLDARELIILNRSLDRLMFSLILVRENIIAGTID